MGAFPRTDRLLTYADYRSWELAEGERYEVIFGEAFAMSAPSERHQSILVELFGRFDACLKGKVFPAPHVLRPFYREDGGDDTIVQPDITVALDEEKHGEEGCRGVPDLVIEILTPFNTAIEMQRKFALYQRVGIPEYWIVDPESRELTMYSFGERTVFQIFRDGDTVMSKALAEVRIVLDRIFDL